MKHLYRNFQGLTFIFVGLLGVTGFTADLAGSTLKEAVAGLNATVPDTKLHRELILEWRQSRNADLFNDFGWLSLVGLEWLQEGENRVGSAQGNAIRLSGGPDYWGSVYLEDNKLRFVRADNPKVTVDESYTNEVIMVADIEGSPTVVQSGAIRFYPIFRESYALRIRIPRLRFG